MAANSTISVTELDFDRLKASMKTFISSRPDFTDYNFEGSTISMLLDLLAYNTYQNAFYASMVGNEMFLDSAQLRDNVTARAKMLGYTPRSARGASTTLAVTITPTGTPDTVTIARNTEWTTAIDGEDLKFVTPSAFIITANNGVYASTITITEGRPITHRFTVDTSSPVRYILPNADVDTTSLLVDVQTSSVDTTLTRYVQADDITQVLANSAVYFLQDTNDRYELYFGDAVLGKSPVTGNIVVVNYRICSGSRGNDISAFTDPSTLGTYSTFTTSAVAASAGGSNTESIASIKFNAPKNFETQNRAVLSEDYKRIILRENGDLASVSVWGGEENSPPIFGKVYISVKPSSGNLVSQDRKNQLKRQLKRYNIVSVDPEFVDASFLYIKPTVIVRYNPNLTTLSATAVQTKVLTAIVTFETNNLGTFTNNKFRHSRFIRALDDADTSIVSSSAAVKMEKRFVPSITAATTYRLAFNNAIDSPISLGHTSHSGSHHVSSTAFTSAAQTAYIDDDGEGILRSYYIQSDESIVYIRDSLGTIDYTTGLLTLNSFFPTAFAGNELSIYADALKNDITAVRNQILLFAGATVAVIDDTTNIVVAVTQEATTAGVTTTVVDTGINSVVY